jgi:hypothetical protein
MHKKQHNTFDRFKVTGFLVHFKHFHVMYDIYFWKLLFLVGIFWLNLVLSREISENIVNRCSMYRRIKNQRIVNWNIKNSSYSKQDNKNIKAL